MVARGDGREKEDGGRSHCAANFADVAFFLWFPAYAAPAHRTRGISWGFSGCHELLERA